MTQKDKDPFLDHLVGFSFSSEIVQMTISSLDDTVHQSFWEKIITTDFL
jgi:hypothetical protein